VRNTIEHPITRAEVTDAIDTVLQRHSDDDRVGDLTGMILSKLLNRIKSDPDVYNQIFSGDGHFES
jgi:hypothetical protein